MIFPVEVFFLILDAFIREHDWRDYEACKGVILTCSWFRAYIAQRIPFVLRDGHLFNEYEVPLIDTLYNILREPAWDRPITFNVFTITSMRASHILLQISKAITIFSGKRVGFWNPAIEATQKDILSDSQYITLRDNCLVESDIYLKFSDTDLHHANPKGCYKFIFYTGNDALRFIGDPDFSFVRRLTREQLARWYQFPPNVHVF